MSSVQHLETRGNSARGRDGCFASASICKTLKPSIVPMSTSKPKISLLEAPGVSAWRLKPHVFTVAGTLPCTPGISTSQASLHPRHLGHLSISPSISPSLHPRHLCIPSTFVPSASPHLGHLPVSVSQASLHPWQVSQGAAPPAQLGCCGVFARAAESSSSQILSFFYKSLATSFS